RLDAGEPSTGVGICCGDGGAQVAQRAQNVDEERLGVGGAAPVVHGEDRGGEVADAHGPGRVGEDAGGEVVTLDGLHGVAHFGGGRNVPHPSGDLGVCGFGRVGS